MDFYFFRWGLDGGLGASLCRNLKRGYLDGPTTLSDVGVKSQLCVRV